MHDDGKLAGDRNGGSLEAELFPEFEPPGPQIAVPSGPRHATCSALKLGSLLDFEGRKIFDIGHRPKDM